jgi:hypothetical protein
LRRVKRSQLSGPTGSIRFDRIFARVLAALVFILGGLAEMGALAVAFDPEHVAGLRPIVSDIRLYSRGHIGTATVVALDVVGHFNSLLHHDCSHSRQSNGHASA